MTVKTNMAYLAGVACAVLAPASLWADVTLTQKVNVTAGGPLAVLGASGTSATYVSGARARVDNRMSSNSGMMARFAGDTDSSIILRLDEELLWQLNPEQQTYSQMTFKALRAQTEQAMAQIEEMGGGGALPINEDDCQWSDPLLSVKETGKKARFGGVRAKQMLITANQTCSIPQEAKSCDVRWTLDYWLASKPPGGKEIERYADAMAKALGGNDTAALVQMQAQSLLSMFKRGWDEVLEETDKLDGHPVKTVMTLSLGGPACTMPSGQLMAMDSMWGSAMDAALDSAAGTAAAHAGVVAQREAIEAVGGGIGGSIAGSAVGSATRDIASNMFQKFKNRKKSKRQEVQAPSSESPENGMVDLFTISTELTDVDKGRVTDGVFEVPAGWTQVAPAGL